MADFIRPSPNDLISDGADAITQNADAAADTLGLHAASIGNHAGRLTNLETATGDLAGSITDLNLRTTDVETAINHALPIVASGRPDIPATTPYSSAQLAAMPSGTVYRSTNGPQGAWEWIRQGGSWVCTAGNINITSHRPAGIGTTGQTRIMRSASTVTLQFTAVTVESIPVANFAPLGFRPASNYVVETRKYWGSEAEEKRARIANSGALESPYLAAGDIINIMATYLTSNPWPTTTV